ncbi:hypothetical protein PUN28_003675 [Cardiocondyla obscurior]|uniref:Plastocyanin-like domain-containing protein n=1 Tax=Cardiocondyla obscurior TaxID=286306 RepID=A0AAW2GP62_9HYME
MFMVENGKRYRYRIISAFSTVCLAEVRIENHSMQIIATDGENVQPISADAITLASVVCKYPLTELEISLKQDFEQLINNATQLDTAAGDT